MLTRKLLPVLVVALFVSWTAPASAAIEFRKIAFDPSGTDDGTNRHLRKEMIVIKNTGSQTVFIDGWKIVDEGRDHAYVFGDRSRSDDVFSDIRLHPGEYVRIHSGRGQDSATASLHGDAATQRRTMTSSGI